MRAALLLGFVSSILLSAGLLTGCSTVSGFQRRPELSSTVEARRKTFFGQNAADKYDQATDPKERLRLRNELVYGKMLVLEDDFQDLERALNGSGNILSTGSDLTVLLLNGIGATVGGKATKAALSAASAGVVGAQGAINKDLYYQSTLPALLSQMEANHEKARLVILRSLTRPDSEYPLKLAEIDLKRLAVAGSIPVAVNQITQQAVKSKDITEQKIEDLRNLTFASTESAKTLQAWLYPDGKANAERNTALQAWLDRQPEILSNFGQGYAPAAFVSGDTDDVLEPVRQRAIADKDLGIQK